MIPKELEWRKVSDHPNEFCDGDNYLLAVQTITKDDAHYKWEFANVFISCDEEYFELKQKNNGVIESYTDYDFFDFEYYIKY